MTIDDLEALRQQLQVNDNQPSVSFGFAGGEFDSAMDIKQLSDSELREIVVKTSDIQVVLSTTHSEAIGSSNSVESVYENWARMRQSKRKPTGWLSDDKGFIVVLLLTYIVAIVALAIFTNGFTRFNPDSIIFVVFIHVWVVGLGFSTIFAPWVFSSCAIIVPMSTDEFRRKELEDHRISKTIWTAIGGVVIGALVTAIVALLTSSSSE